MALDITFTVAIDSDRSDVTLTDSTVFGSPNQVRASCGVFVSAAKVTYAGVETDLAITTDDSDPETDSTFSFSYTNGDGYYKIRYVAIPDYDAGTTYAKYAAVFAPATNIVYRSKSAGNVGNAVTDTVYWEVITDEAGLADNKDEATESENIDSLVYERVFTSNAQYGYGNLVSQNSMHTESDDEDVTREYDIFSLMLNGAITADERTEVLSGELICRKIESRFSKYIDE